MVTEKSDLLVETLLYYRDMYEGKLVVSTGWGYSGMVLLDHCRKVWARVPVVSVNTGFLFRETLDFAYAATRLMNLDVTWDWETDCKQNPPGKQCCLERKVFPMGRLLEPYDAWITALRFDQATTRAEQREVSVDRWGKIKLAPMLKWTSDECWRYIRENNVPVQPLHELGYRSIGCRPCTSLPASDDERSGRWNGERNECGLHER